MNEDTGIWIEGYEGIYSVNDKGDVFSYKKGPPFKLKNQTNRGYYIVALCKKGKTIRYLVHRLVAKAFLGEPPPGLIVCHNDGNGQNNQLSNLRYDSYSSNNFDKAKHGYVYPIADKVSQTKLLLKEAIEIIDLDSKNELTQREIAEMYNVSRGTISSLVRNKSWKHINREPRANKTTHRKKKNIKNAD